MEMTLREARERALALIEELSPNSSKQTADPDLAAKINIIVDQVQHELARYKKIPLYVELPVQAGETVTKETIEQKCGKQIYQLSAISGVEYESRAEGTVIKIRSGGTMEVDCFVYPEKITDETQDSHKLELAEDALAILPYGVAADLLKSDASVDYGRAYQQRYVELRDRLDPRFSVNFVVEGGADV